MCVYVCLSVLAYVCVKRASHPFSRFLSLSPQFYLCVCECVSAACVRVWFIVLCAYHYVYAGVYVREYGLNHSA